VKGGKVTMKRSPEPIYFSGSLEAGDVVEGALDVDVALTILPDDMTIWRKALTGSVSGTSISTTPQYGSFEYTFAKGADSLKLAGSSVAFLCDLPDADPSGKPVEHELAGKAYRGAAATPVTITLINTQATY
jgi:hypothetical protein